MEQLKQFILLRHATRASSFESDTPLSTLGHAQAASAPRVFARASGHAPGHVPGQISGQISDPTSGQALLSAMRAPDQIFASPKLRARQTLAPLGQALNLLTQVDERLDERHNEESRVSFEKRIQSFLNMVMKLLENDPSGTVSSIATTAVTKSATTATTSNTIMACSHMDWLEAVLPLMNSNLSDRELTQPWAAGEYRCFDWTPEGIWTLSHTGVLREG